MKEFIEYIVRPLVDHPDQISVEEVIGVRTTVYELRVGQGDLGKVIGKNGQTAKAIRTLAGGHVGTPGKTSSTRDSGVGDGERRCMSRSANSAGHAACAANSGSRPSRTTVSAFWR